ncbi:hypothetical protein [Rathayibacter sp. VKM Ac-2801]|uniref:hypothetical protein n=1 Tax=Rathayibacter sp. VKM Ac-2801 TaxID=2609255 RepID=UPI00132051C9|nr:hypothetical protein [Rathayibacter sp. VKM Ac-2801]QHC71844.1 hypothetical protein GSU45_16570 [Rathayibacter sp. VKM Ac-2801]
MNLTDHLPRASSWEDRQAAAETMIPLIGELYRRRDVITSLHRRSFIDHQPGCLESPEIVSSDILGSR